MTDDQFYSKADPQQIVKTRIVVNYFSAWKNVILKNMGSSTRGLAYADLFCGPGQFDDGTPSTPLWILQHAISDERLRRQLRTFFNDKNQEHVTKLQNTISSTSELALLENTPRVSSSTVGTELMRRLRTEGEIPTLYFVDPFGYKGLSIDLLGEALKGWGCDLIFFFNYNRVNPGLSNDLVAEHMADLFGDERFARLSSDIRGLNPSSRKVIILDELIESLKDVGGRFVLPFEFQREQGERTSHYIVFVSKNRTGYEIMKDIMYRLSSDDAEVKEFVFIPVPSSQMRLPGDISRQYSIQVLKDQLMVVCSGQQLSVRDIYETYSLDTPYLENHFKTALIGLEDEFKITVDKPREKRMRMGKVTLGDKRIITFPS